MPPYAWIGPIVLVGFLTVGTLISFALSKNANYMKRYTVAPGAATGRPPPSMGPRGPGVMSMNISGHLHFKSAAAKMGIISGVVVAIGGVSAIGGAAGMGEAFGDVSKQLPLGVLAIAVGLLVAFLAYRRPKGGVQNCYVDQNGAITLMRDDVQFPFDFSQYRCVRMDCSSTKTWGFGSGPQILVLYRDTLPSSLKRWGSIWFPRFNDERAVLLLHGWRTAEGHAVGGYDLAALFYQACVRAGRRPVEIRHIFAKSGWQVRPDY